MADIKNEWRPSMMQSIAARARPAMGKLLVRTKEGRNRLDRLKARVPRRLHIAAHALLPISALFGGYVADTPLVILFVALLFIPSLLIVLWLNDVLLTALGIIACGVFYAVAPALALNSALACVALFLGFFVLLFFEMMFESVESFLGGLAILTAFAILITCVAVLIFVVGPALLTG